MNFSMDDWIELSEIIIEIFIHIFWCFAILDLTLKNRKKDVGKIRFLYYLKILLPTFFLLLISTLGIFALSNYAARHTSLFAESNSLIFETSVFAFIIYNTFCSLVPAYTTFMLSRFYDVQLSTRAFLAAFTGLLNVMLSGYLATIPKSFFLVENKELEIMEEPPFLINIAILGLVLFLFYFIYNKKLRKRMELFLYSLDNPVVNFIKVSVFSIIIFNTVTSALYTLSIDYTSIVITDKIIWHLVMGGFVLAYAMLYWFIVQSITLTSQSAKNRAELDVANKIQASVLPSTFPAFPGRNEFDIYASMSPAKEVGGDFYDFFIIDDNKLAVVIADVSDKGIPAALYMMSVRTMIKNECMREDNPSHVFMSVNEQLCKNNEEGMFVTAFLAIVNFKEYTMVFSNAGHTPPFFNASGHKAERLQTKQNLVLGAMNNITYENQFMDLKPGTKLFFYTDGVTEAANSSQELFGEKRLEEVLNNLSDASAAERIYHIHDILTDFSKGTEQADDITMLSLEIK